MHAFQSSMPHIKDRMNFEERGERKVLLTVSLGRSIFNTCIFIVLIISIDNRKDLKCVCGPWSVVCGLCKLIPMCSTSHSCFTLS
jgi:hypothetical protein